MSIKRSFRKSRRGIGARPPVLYACEPLESRTLLNTVIIQGDAGTSSITLSSHTTFHLGIHYFVDWSINDINNGQTQSAALGLTDKVMVDTGPAEVGVNVLSTIAPTTIQGDSPSDDILNLGGSNGLQGIAWPITITDTAGFWDITADDTNDTTARTGTLSDGSLTGLAPANITWDATKCHGLSIDSSTAGGNTLAVSQTNVQTTIQGHSSGTDDSVTVGNSIDGLTDITAPLNIGNGPIPSGLINLTLDDQPDPVHADYILDDGSLGVEAGSSASFTSNVSWNASAVRGLTLKTEAHVPGQSQPSLWVVNTNVSTMIVGDSSSMGVTVGESFQGHTFVGILGDLFVTNPAKGTTLDVWPTAAVAPVVTLHTVMVPGDPTPYGAIDGLAPGRIAYKYADTATVQVHGGGQSVEVAATGTDTTLDYPWPMAKVGDAGSIQNIAGNLSISGGSVTVDDSADPVSHDANISLVPGFQRADVMIEGLSPASIHCAASGSLTINGGSAPNAYSINAPLPQQAAPPGLAIVLNTGGGEDAVQVLATAFGRPLTINGQGGNDTFTVAHSASQSFLGSFIDSISDDLVFNGGAGADTLTVIGAAATRQFFSITPGTITLLGRTTTYVGIKNLVLSSGDFAIKGDLGGVNLNAAGFSRVTIQVSTHLDALSIGSGTQVALAPAIAPLSNTLFCTGLSIDATGKLDLANNPMQLNYSGADPVSMVRTYLAGGYKAGAWNGNGIMTSAGDAAHGLGLGDSADGVVAGLSANTLLVRFTRYGDVSLDGSVGFADLVALARHYGQSNASWDQGDMNYDGAVGFDDLVTVARNYGATAAVRPASAVLVAAPREMPIKMRKRR